MTLTVKHNETREFFRRHADLLRYDEAARQQMRTDLAAQPQHVRQEIEAAFAELRRPFEEAEAKRRADRDAAEKAAREAAEAAEQAAKQAAETAYSEAHSALHKAVDQLRAAREVLPAAIETFNAAAINAGRPQVRVASLVQELEHRASLVLAELSKT